VPDVEQHVLGTPEEPAARVHRYKAMDGGFAKTGHYTGHKCKHLSRLQGGLTPPRTTKTSRLPAAKRAAFAPVDDLPLLRGGKTDSEWLLESVEALVRTVDPEGIRAIAAEEFERRVGAI
jgi:hypothetical protein